MVELIFNKLLLAEPLWILISSIVEVGGKREWRWNLTSLLPGLESPNLPSKDRI